LRSGDIRQANARFREILEREPQNPDAMSGLLFCSNYDPELSPERIAEAYKSWDRRFVQWRAPPPDFKFANTPQPKRRIKLGYVSGDLRGHSVAFFAEPLLANHDHEQFEVFCYANQKGGDATTGRLMKMADHWRWTLDLSDEAVIEMIRMDGIDILIDLSNHTAYHRLYMFGRKPAPIQMTTIGMPTTTGLSAIDYRITDAYMDPPGMTEHLHAEKLLRILSHWCYRPSDEAVDLLVAETPALKNGFLSFASFNAFGKINTRVFKLWGRILQAIPNAVLYVATGAKEGDRIMAARIKKTCKSCGIPLRRLRLMPRKTFKDYCEFHQEIDIVLDAFPYTGATVTAHALWMGVPVITLAGPSPIHRSATSMMNSVGLPEFVAQSQDEYLEIAKHWAADIEGLAEIRRNLRPKMQASPLMDGARVTRDLEEKLRQVWQDWCKIHKPKRMRKTES
jgi:predicted O-linked N-acetylglucosamine transferase (SPINDLY family)